MLVYFALELLLVVVCFLEKTLEATDAADEMCGLGLDASGIAAVCV